MMTKIAFTLLACIMSLAVQGQFCSQFQSDERIHIGPEVRADLAYIFKKEITSDEVNEFQRTVMGIPNESNSGYSSLPGVMSEVMFYKDNFRGEALRFKPSATAEQKAVVKRRILESPLVYRVYENVAPDEITDLPEDTERAKPNNDPTAKPTRKPNKIVITPDS